MMMVGFKLGRGCLCAYIMIAEVEKEKKKKRRKKKWYRKDRKRKRKIEKALKKKQKRIWNNVVLNKWCVLVWNLGWRRSLIEIPLFETLWK